MKYASYTSRAVAAVIDFTIAFIIGMSIGFPLGYIAALLGIGFPTSLVDYLAGVGYFVYFDIKSGQTFGKKIMGIMVVSLSSKKLIGLGEALFRELLGKFISGFFMLGFIWPLWDENKQAWHDKIAHTVVVKI